MTSCRDWETALLTARAMVGAARPGGVGGEASHWTERAEALLAPLLHAAAVSDAGMTQVVRWVNRHDLDTGLAALSVAGAELAGDVLAGLAATDGPGAVGHLVDHRRGPGRLPFPPRPRRHRRAQLRPCPAPRFGRHRLHLLARPPASS